jgi:hypothetical protein
MRVVSGYSLRITSFRTLSSSRIPFPTCWVFTSRLPFPVGCKQDTTNYLDCNGTTTYCGLQSIAYYGFGKIVIDPEPRHSIHLRSPTALRTSDGDPDGLRPSRRPLGEWASPLCHAPRKSRSRKFHRIDTVGTPQFRSINTGLTTHWSLACGLGNGMTSALCRPQSRS